MKIVASVLLTAFAVVAMSGCTQQLSYVTTEYGKVDRVEYTEPASGEVFWIFPRRDINKLMVSINPGRAGQRGMAMSASLGLAERASLGDMYKVVAESYLASIGLTCTATDATVLLDPQYEVTFACR